ncbi:putative repeat protein (TIGR01451 family), partial [Flavobacterium circumlabens]
MSPTLLLLIRSLFLKNLRLLFFLISFSAVSQNTITRIHTDWKGYWTSNSTTGVGNRPDRENNLLAFTWAQNGKTYSTGVSDNTLTTNAVTFSPQKFRALKIQTIGIDPGSMYILQGSMIDESASGAILTPKLIGTTATGAELASRLTDGPNGLALGTGIANIKAGTAEFKIGTNNLNLTGLNDDTPDLIVTQVAEPGSASLADKFKFIDASGNTVGNEISVSFISVPAVGTYSLDLFKMDGSYGFTPAATRDIRMLGIETSSFGITAANASQVDRFVVTFSGSSDCAFIAFNTKSLKIAELKLVTTSSIIPCGKLGDTVNYTYEVTNNGEVPITNIQVADPMSGMTITGNPIASLAVGAKATLTGTYVITNADVAAGRIVNMPKVTGTDPSLNTVEDVSLPIETILLAPPTIDKIVNITCSSLGSVVFTNLPSDGNWIIERSPGSVKTNGSGTTATITGLAVGNYTFRITNSYGCKSPATTTVPISNQSATTWNGSIWSGGNPDITKNVVFNGAYTITSDLEACSCTINSGVNLLVPAGRTLTVTNALNVTSGGTLTFENNSSLMQDSDAV